MSKQQIEDVLSSIRRLVSEDSRRSPGHDPALFPTRPDHGAGRSETALRLASATALPERSDDPADDAGADIFTLGQEFAVSVPEAAVSQSAEECELQGNPGSQDLAEVEGPASDPLMLTPALRVGEGDPEGEISAEAAPVMRERARASLEETIASLGSELFGSVTPPAAAADVAAPEEEVPEPEGDGRAVAGAVEEEIRDAMTAEAERLAARISDAAARARERSDGRGGVTWRSSRTVRPSSGAEAAEVPEMAPEERVMPRRLHLSSSAPDAVKPVPQAGDAEEPNLSVVRDASAAESYADMADPETGTDRAWGLDDATEAPFVDAGRDSEWDLDDVPVLPEGRGASTFPGEAAEAPLIDETILRGIVAEILREELQGALGERITRSVRRLVRREVLRVIASRGME